MTAKSLPVGAPSIFPRFTLALSGENERGLITGTVAISGKVQRVSAVINSAADNIPCSIH